MSTQPDDRDSLPGFWRGCAEDWTFVVVATGTDPTTGPYIIPPDQPGYAGGGTVDCTDLGVNFVEAWVLNGYTGNPQGGDSCSAQLFVDEWTFGSVCP